MWCIRMYTEILSVISNGDQNTIVILCILLYHKLLRAKYTFKRASAKLYVAKLSSYFSFSHNTGVSRIIFVFTLFLIFYILIDALAE